MGAESRDSGPTLRPQRDSRGRASSPHPHARRRQAAPLEEGEPRPARGAMAPSEPKPDEPQTVPSATEPAITRSGRAPGRRAKRS